MHKAPQGICAQLGLGMIKRDAHMFGRDALYDHRATHDLMPVAEGFVRFSRADARQPARIRDGESIRAVFLEQPPHSLQKLTAQNTVVIIFPDIYQGLIRHFCLNHFALPM